MSSSMDLEQVERKARQSANQDGILYFFMGLLLVMVGVSFVIPPLSWIGILGILFVFPAEWLRRRVSYPRIGYAKFQASPGLWRGMGLFAAVAIVALIIAAFVWPQIMSILVGIVFGFSFYFGASMSGVRLPDWAVIGLMLVSGMITAVLFDDWHVATAVQLSLIGIILVLIGLIDLVHFIRTYPMIDGEFETDQGGV